MMSTDYASIADSVPSAAVSPAVTDSVAAVTAGAAPVVTGEKKGTANPFDAMCAEISEALSGDYADIDHIQEILDSYKSDVEDWKRFAHFNQHSYTRNLVDDGNGKYNIMLLCWDVGQASSIHDHAGSHCFMKILNGELTQQLYDTPDKIESAHAPLQLNAESCHSVDDVLYISDKIGTHRVANTSHSATAVSMHIYSPPYSECKCFDERTGGQRSSGCITFFSKNGVCGDEQWKCKFSECNNMARMVSHVRTTE
eukprot:m.98885 g.98885  ORF g.98885 m.98885 type:complete len:255 (+) comp13129_c0_seq2:304-1068(+)